MKKLITLLSLVVLVLSSHHVHAQNSIIDIGSRYETDYVGNGVFVTNSEDCNFQLMKVTPSDQFGAGYGKDCNGSPLHLSKTHDGSIVAYASNGAFYFLTYNSQNEFGLEYQQTNIDQLIPTDIRNRQNGGAISGDGTKLILDGHVFSIEKTLVNDWRYNYTLTAIDTIPAYDATIPGPEWNQPGNRMFHRAKHYTNFDGTRYVIVYLENMGDAIELRLVTSSYDAENDQWLTSLNEGIVNQLRDVINIDVSDDLSEITFVGPNGRKVFPIGLAMDAFASSTTPGDGSTYDGPLPINLNTIFMTDGNTEMGVYAEAISGNGEFMFRAVSNSSIEVYKFNNETNEFDFLKSQYAHPNAEYDQNWRENRVVGMLHTNYDGSAILTGSTWKDEWRDGQSRYYQMYLSRVDLAGPELASFYASEMDSLAFVLDFTERVSRPTDDGYGNVQPRAPQASDLEILLNGEPADPNVVQIRNIINVFSPCPTCYEPSQNWVISLRTPNGPISGDLQVRISENNQLFDEAGNAAVVGSTTQAVSVEGLDTGGYILEVVDGDPLGFIVDYAGPGDTVLVHPGDYDLEGGLEITNKSIVLTSTYDETVDNQEAVMTTRLLAMNCNGIRAFETGALVINGFSIVNESENCDNMPSYGVEVYVHTPSVISNNLITGFKNGVGLGGRIDGASEADPVGAFYGNVITKNRMGLTVWEGRWMIAGNVLFDNGVSERDNNCCELGGVRIFDADVLFAYNYVIDNMSYENGAGITLHRSYADIYNNVVWGNEAKRGASILLEDFGLPNFDHNIVENYGLGRNKVVEPGANIYTEDPMIQTSHEPFEDETGFITESRFGVHTKVSENSIIFGNGWEVDLNMEIAMGMTRIPEPISSSPDISPFEHSNGMRTNPMVQVDLNYPSQNAQNIGSTPGFGWNPIKYATSYELQISSTSAFDQPLTIEVEGTELLELNNALEAIDGAYYWRVRGINPTKEGEWSDVREFTTGTSSVSNETLTDMPMKYELFQNYPNPFNPSTQIKFALPEASVVRVEVYNSLGQQVAVLTDGFMNAGYHQLSFKASDLSSGVYLYKITTPNFTQTKKMLLMK